MPDSDNDSDFAEYGTSLEAIEEEDAAVRKKPISIQDQVAVDERGRRRFHGAFTGGFSAGYFNTVGSKEGWAPSTFKSSRADRNSFKSQNVLDFMDDEDKGAFGIAPQILRPTDDFTDRNEQRGRKRPLQRQNEGPIPGMPVLEQVLQPVKETVGIKILIKMGWRPGKGVGPKIQKGVKKPRLEVPENTSEAPETSGKMYGCSLPAGVRLGTGKEDDSDETDEEILDAEELLAPEDVSEIFCKPKENSFGLGYKGLDRNTLSSSASHADLFGGAKLKFRVENKNMSITGEAFGVGAFEDHDADIYSREDMSQYDFALETPDEKRRRKEKEKRDKQKSSKTKENCIEGFKLSSSAKLKWKTYPAPRLPSNFEPFHKAKKSRFELPKPVPVASNATTTAGGKEEAVAKGLGRHSLTISERQVLIESDINKVKPKDKDAVQDQSTAETIDDSTAPPQQQQPTQAEIDADIQHRIERLKKFTQVLQSYSANKPEVTEKASFKPFMKNPEKQERYEKYLTLLNAGFSECLRDLQPPDMAEWERDREKLEFERASKLYKPMSSILSSRFTSAKSHDISHLEVEKEVVQEKDPKDDPKVAARMKLFGKLTHRVMEWHPDKLVCKRFNIPHPYPDSKFVGVKDPTIFESRSATQNAIQAASASQTVTAPPPAKKSLFDNLDFSKPPPGLLPPDSVQSSSFSGTPMECSEAPGTEPTPSVLAFQKELTTSAADEKNKETASSDIIVRAPLDLFKEIFADSTDESGDEEDAEIESSNLSTNPKIPNQRNSKSIPEQTTSDKHRARDDAKSDKAATCHNDGKSLPMEAESVNHEDRKGSGAQERRIFDKINLDWFRSNQEHSSTKRKRNEESSDSVPRKSNDYAGDEDEEEDVYGPLPPKSTSSSSNEDNNARQNLQKPTFIPRNPSTAAKTPPVSSNIMNYNHQSKSSYDDERKKVKNTEEVIWVEKSALSDRTHVKSKKHSSSKKKSSKSHKSSRGHKHKKKASRKRKSKKHRRENSDSESSSSDSKNKKSDDEDSSASSDSSVTINDSLDNKALLAKLKQITRH